jgi:Ca2+:H+ antiporter
VLLPAAFHIAVHPTTDDDPLTGAQESHDILSISHGVRSAHLRILSFYADDYSLRLQLPCFSVSSMYTKPHFIVTKFMLLVYLCYLGFQLFSHKNIYDDHHPDVQQSVRYTPGLGKMLHIDRRKSPLPSLHNQAQLNGAMKTQRDKRSVEEGPMEEDGVEVPEMSIRTTISLLLVVTAVC